MRLSIQIDKTVYIEYNTKGTPEDFQEFMRGFLEWMAQKVIDRIDEVIRRKLYNWHPLSKSWINFKKKMGLDPRIWVASGQTKKAITFWYSGLADAYFIGVHPRTLHRRYRKGGVSGEKTKARLLDIINWLEFGTTKMKARPLFTPVLREFKPKQRQQKLYQEYVSQIKGG